MHKRLRCLVIIGCLSVCSLYASTPTGAAPAVTPVSGESWLNHLHRSFGDTSMCKTGRLGPPPSQAGDAAQPPVALLRFPAQTVSLHGADLYRINCQGCHGDAGLGAPPEINSVINPVRATSVSLVLARMKERGMEMSRADATELATQSKTALLERLHKGGESMPPFTHLSEAEIASLVGYLGQLADIPGAQGQQVSVAESPARIGEHIVKSTCHTCHDATGANPTPQQLEDGAIPPLETLAARVRPSEFVRKVTAGAPIVMGTPPTPHRGRMPVFYYLTDDEAADVYFYLTLYPPKQTADSEPAIALSQQSHPAGGPSTPAEPKLAPVAINLAVQPAEPARATTMEIVLLLAGLVSMVILMVAGGIALTIHEFRRLSADSENQGRRRSEKLQPSKVSPTYAASRGGAIHARPSELV
ncbi:MAG: c-type cytochrome [Candidatus Korobacteraceae bacterium]